MVDENLEKSTSSDSSDESPEAEKATDSASVNGEKPATSQEASESSEDWQKKFLYLSAEFENFRKRMHKERMDHVKFGHESLMLDMLQVMDNFERALEHAQSQSFESASPFQKVVEGIQMISVQLNHVMNNHGVKSIESVGKEFNPNFHEAISQEGAGDGVAANTILKEHQKGYTLHDRLLRPSKVVIAVK